MGISGPSGIEVILDELKGWSHSDRIRLARRILETLEPAVPRAPARSLKDLIGLLKTAARPPGDEECRKILEDELVRKHLR
jgi:hypothetical protein